MGERVKEVKRPYFVLVCLQARVQSKGAPHGKVGAPSVQDKSYCFFFFFFFFGSVWSFFSHLSGHFCQAP